MQASKVVSMVTEIKYANRTGKVEFDSGKSVDMTYSIQSEFQVIGKQ